MTLSFIITLFTICLLGAMSPGPSLAVVAKHSLTGGRIYGIAVAWSHALGILIYAFLTMSGLSILLTHSPMLFKAITYLGAGYLAYLGIRSLLSKGGLEDKLKSGNKVSIKQVMIDGLAISLLNPKIALFFIALFSQFINEANSASMNLVIAFTPAILDGLWYTLVAIILSNSTIIQHIRSKAAVIDKVTGLLLILLALKVVFN
ncbi:LysE family translocator [Marinomonas sp.]